MGKAKRDSLRGSDVYFTVGQTSESPQEMITTKANKLGRGRVLQGFTGINILSGGNLEATFVVSDNFTTLNGTYRPSHTMHSDTEIGHAIKHLLELLESEVKQFEKIPGG